MSIPTADLAHALAPARDYTESILRQLIAEPSVRGGFTRVHDVVADELQSLGFKVNKVSVPASGPRTDPEWSPPEIVEANEFVNLLATSPGPNRIAFFAHLDTEPVGETVEWRFSPFEPTVVDGRLFGIGAADDKAGISSILGALTVLRDLPVDLPGISVLAVHAKQGGALGTLPMWRTLQDAQVAIYCHPGETGRGLTEVKVASRGIAAIEISIQGLSPEPTEIRTPASADPAKGVNAVEVGMRISEALRSWASNQDRLTLSITGFESVSQMFTVPDRCVVRAAIWFERGTFAGLQAAVAELMDGLLADDAWLQNHPPNLRLVGLRANPAAVPPTNRLVRAILRASEAVTGQVPKVYGGHAASDIRFPIRCQGIPCVGLGPTAGGFYGPNEWVDLASLHATAEILVRTVLTLMDRNN